VLAELTIQNFAIIDQVHLRSRPALPCLPARQGRQVDHHRCREPAIGRPGRPQVIRAEADRAMIEGVFALDGEVQLH